LIKGIKTDFKNSCLIPIVIGVTGHRDLLDEDILRLKSEVATFFKTTHEDYPESPLILLSLLAEGADRLVADVAMELKEEKDKNGAYYPISLVVPLPLPKEEYKKDFKTEESNAYFDTVLARKDVIHFELPPLTDDSEGNISKLCELRNQHYFAGGRFVVEHCQILISLWDGVHSNKTGGTSDVVEMQLDGDTERTDWSENVLSPLTTGPVYHIMTRRKSHESDVMPEVDKEYLEKRIDKKKYKVRMEPCGLNLLYPLDEITGKSLRTEKGKILKNINDYNKDLKDGHEELKHKFNSAIHHLIPAEAYCPPELEVFKKYYACSTTIAAEYKNKVISLLSFIAYSMPPTVLFFEVYSNMAVSHAFWILYAAFAGSTYLYYWLSKRDRNHDKFLDYRALAEGLRVQFYWKQAGIKESVATFYLRKHISELEWIRYAIRNIDLILLKRQDSVDEPSQCPKIKDRIDSAIKAWIDEESKFFRDRIEKFVAEFEASEKRANILFFMTLLFITPALLINHTLNPGGHWDHYFHIMVPVLFVIAGAHKFYNEKMLYKQNIKQYSRMLDTFSRARNRLNNIAKSDKISEDNKVKESQKILEFLGKEALAENGDWLLMHREQPIEPPQKG
jgi:hypothetical protein